MGVGYVADDEEEAEAAPLDTLNVQQAAEYLARAGGRALPVDAVSGGAAPDAVDLEDALLAEPAGDPPAPAAATEDPQQEATAASGPHTPAPAGSTPAPATTYPQPPTFPELGPPPPPPAFTGDPQKDVALNAQWQRDLVAHHGELTKRQTALAEHAAAVGAMRGQKEAEVAAVEAREKKAELARAAAERKERSGQITEAVNARLAAARDVEGFKWDRPHTGKEIAAIIIGGAAAALSNVAAIQAGHAPTAQNEGAKGIEARMKREYDAKKAKLAQAGDNVLIARHGAKDAQEAHRAAMNDLDADFAARYKAIAKDAEEALRRAGVPKAQVDGNVLVASALEKAAQHEGDIHNREEGHADQRKQADATLALARANLGERRAEHAENLEDRRAARADRDAAKRDKEKDKEEREYVRGDDGQPIGRVPGGRGGAQAFASRDAEYHRAANTLKALIADVKAHGDRVVKPEAVKRRNDLYANATIGVATVSPLGKTDSALHEEQASIGSSGAADIKNPLSVVAGANLGALERKLHEIEGQRQQYRTQTLIPLEPGEAKAGARVSLPPAERGGSKASELSETQAATLIDHLQSNPNDPRADRIRAKLEGAGYKVPKPKRKGR